MLGPVARRGERDDAHVAELDRRALADGAALEVDLVGIRHMDRRAGRLGETTAAGDVVGVVVRLEDVPDLEAVLLGEREVLLDLPLRVDHGADAAVGHDVGGAAEVAVQHLAEEHLRQRLPAVVGRGGRGRHGCSGCRCHEWPKLTFGRMRSSQRGSAQAERPRTRSSVGTRTSRTSMASSRTAMPRMTPISFGGSGPERAKVKKTATMTAAAAKITRPEWASPPTIASCGSPEPVEVLLGRGEQEQGVVHRDREDHREEEDGAPGVEESLRLEAEQAGAVAVLEDQAGDAEGGSGCEQVRHDAERGDQRRLEGDEQEQEAEREHDADHERRLRGERLLEVVVLGHGAADQSSRRQGSAEPVDRVSDGGVRWIGVRHRLDQREPVARPAGAARRRAMPGSRPAAAATAAALRCGVTIWSAPGAPTPKACCTCA